MQANDLQLQDLITQLRLAGIRDTLDGRLKQARDATLSYEELLTMLLQDELEHSEQQALSRRVDLAKFEELKTFESLDLKRYSLNIRHAINDLMTCKFLKEKSHVIIMGPVGTGKTHLAQALGYEACLKRKKVKFVTTSDLLSEFYRARADATHDKLFKRYCKFDLLILDDFGLKPLSQEQSSDLYDLIATKHINSSLIITTNRKIEGWTELFSDPVMANAALDRIVNKAYRIVLEGESYRKNFTPKFAMGGDKQMEAS